MNGGTCVAPSLIVGASEAGFVCNAAVCACRNTDMIRRQPPLRAEVLALPSTARVCTLVRQCFYVDGLRVSLEGRGQGSFVNDACPRARNNARMASLYPRGQPMPRALIIVARPIAAGEEVLASYGKGYWQRYERERADNHMKHSRYRSGLVGLQSSSPDRDCCQSRQAGSLPCQSSAPWLRRQRSPCIACAWAVLCESAEWGTWPRVDHPA